MVATDTLSTRPWSASSRKASASGAGSVTDTGERNLVAGVVVADLLIRDVPDEVAASIESPAL